jgi:hypothetical protein
MFLRHVDALLRGEGRLRDAVRAVLWSGAWYGAVMGSFGGWADGRAIQALYSGVKVPLLLGVTTLLALPSFFVLNTLLGLRPDFPQALRAVVGTQGAVAVVLAALAPYTAVWYASTADHGEAIVFNGLVFASASMIAQRVLRTHYAPLVARDMRHRAMLWLWLIVYCFIAVQMAWVLRPFVGHPGTSPSFFREGAWGNAYVAVLETLWRAVSE